MFVDQATYPILIIINLSIQSSFLATGFLYRVFCPITCLVSLEKICSSLLLCKKCSEKTCWKTWDYSRNIQRVKSRKGIIGFKISSISTTQTEYINYTKNADMQKQRGTKLWSVELFTSFTWMFFSVQPTGCLLWSSPSLYQFHYLFHAISLTTLPFRQTAPKLLISVKAPTFLRELSISAFRFNHVL